MMMMMVMMVIKRRGVMEKSEDDFGKYQRQIESEDKNEKKIKTRLMVGMIKRKGKKKRAWRRCRWSKAVSSKFCRSQTV